MNEDTIRKIVRDELSKAKIVFSRLDEKDKETIQLIARLSLPEKLNKTTLGASNDNNRKE